MTTATLSKTLTKGAETRQTILDEALAATSRVGLEGLSIGSLARQVGMSKSGLFAHFESKEDLQRQVIERARDRFIEAVWVPALPVPRGEPRLRALFDNWLAWEAAKFLPGGCPFVAMAIELDDHPGPLRDLVAGTQRAWLDGLARALEIAVEEGHFRADLDCAQAAHEIYSMALAFHHVDRLLRDPVAAERTRTSFERLIAYCRA